MPGGQFPGGPGGYGGGMSNPHDTRDGSGNIPSEQGGGGARWGLQIGPPGRWWDDKHFVKSLHLRPDQQRRMDGIFEQSRPTLLKRYEALQKEQQQMETLTRARTLDENALFTQIDRVEQARADLAKATTHMFYQLRGEMDADQIAKIEQ
jgi:Spy/CpxP family protein refolding chaperone